MKTIKVQYKVKADYAEQNKKNIKAVMAELAELNQTDICYYAHVGSDNQSFMHILTVENDDDASIIPNLAAFKIFREQLSTGLEVPPSNEEFTPIR